MTRDVDLLLIEELRSEDNTEAQLDIINCLNLDESIDHLCGVDPDTGEMDPDSGLLFPQPIHEEV